MGAGPGGRDVDRIADLVLDSLADDGHLLLLTDYDGTLAPIASEPEAARLPETVRADLLALARMPRVQFGVVSGRDLQDLRALVDVPDAVYGGCYGLEIEGPGMRFVHPDAEAQAATLDAISRELSLRAPTVPGMRVEPKRFGLAVHYRHVAADLRERVETETARAIQKNGSRLKIFHGLQVMEIQPQVGWTKGDCVLWIRDVVRRTSGDRLTVLYMGDDWTDEFAFHALTEGALTISVGTLVPASKAAHRVEDVTAARQLLATIAARAGRGDDR
jgi:trehalose 6-phosphate phosphatase